MSQILLTDVRGKFLDYFKKNNYGNKAEFQTYTNGIDDLFLNNTEENVKKINKPKNQNKN